MIHVLEREGERERTAEPGSGNEGSRSKGGGGDGGCACNDDGTWRPSRFSSEVGSGMLVQVSGFRFGSGL
ncbi:hypothetical protein Hanom_Chr16g01472611 [Helianthus anomalus]